MRLAIYGTGGSGREIAELVKASKFVAQQSTEIDLVFVDDAGERDLLVAGLQVLSFEELLHDMHRDRQVVFGIGDGRIRARLESRLSAAGVIMASVLADSARLLGEVEIAPAAVICDFVLVGPNVSIGRNFQANYFCQISHDCTIGDYVTLGPRVSLNGAVEVENFAYIGAGAVVRQGSPSRAMVIGEGAIVGMGAVVTRSVEPYSVVAGNPARVIRRLEPPAGSAYLV